MEVLYKESCPSCGSEIARSRLIYGLPCTNCDGKGGLIKWMKELERRVKEFEEFLWNTYKIEPHSVQRTWIKLLLSGEDVVIAAPTGMGKSTILSAYASYVGKRGKRVLYVVPTRSLVDQVKAQLRSDVNVEVTTSAKILRDPSKYKGYDVIIMDDVDAALKSEKTVAALLTIAGLEDVYEDAKRAAKLLLEAMRGKEEALEEYKRLRLKLRKRKKKAQLIFSSATYGRPSLIAKLMLSALGIRPVALPPILREIRDVKMKLKSLEEQLPHVVKELSKSGYGGIVFVHEGGPREKVLNVLLKNGIKAKEVKSRSLKALREFERGEVDVLVASASRYGVVARGIDMPERLRFVVFVEPPHRKLELRKALLNPLFLLRILKRLGMEREFLDLAKRLRGLSKLEIALLRESLTEGRVEIKSEKLNEISLLVKELAEKAEARLKDAKLIDPPFVIKDGEVILLDRTTYLQASGRTSRLTLRGFTKGVSVVLYSDNEVMEAFEKTLSDITTFTEELETPRGYEKVEVESALMIVESPTKARTIAKIFGGSSSVNLFGQRVHLTSLRLGKKVYFLYIIATKGHLFDLTLDPIGLHGILVEDQRLVPVYSPIKRCSKCGYSWSSSEKACPKCGSHEIENSIDRVNSIRRLAYVVDLVILATDPDEEGEKIAWDLEAMIKPFNGNIKRATYFEVTRRGIEEALANLRDVDYSVVKSQIVRRIDDRIVGFEVSKELWKRFSRFNIGLGRVQGPVLNYVIERNIKWKDSRGFIVILELENRDVLRVFTSEKERVDVILSLKEVEITDKKEWIEEIPPPPPLTTDELLAEASKVGIDANKAMRIAQTLFELGLITYHRTDSRRVSTYGIGLAKELISKEFGKEYFVPRTWEQGGAHEAIRPVRSITPKELFSLIYTDDSYSQLTREHVKIYEIVFKRFVASQMRNVEVRKARVKYKVDSIEVEKEHIVEILRDGWNLAMSLRVFPYTLETGPVKVLRARSLKASKYPLPSISEVIKWMKEVGIGRPSTYARTLEALRRHGLVIPSKYRKLLIATRDGIRVREVIGSSVPELLSVEYTRRLQEIMERAPEEFEEILFGIVEKSKAIREAFASVQS